ncbi:MAG: hypothetical protein GEU80_14880 [Dehalococcoidia bacterium]|nr:hypothetical protein [Dehalococcoidia bacterium]
MVSNVGRSLDDFSIPTSQRVAGPELDQQDFLKLMVEQLRGQNPLQPQDNNQFFSQMTQFQTLDAMQSISKAISTLVELSGLANASALIGRSVTAEIPGGEDPETGLLRDPELVEGVVDRVSFEAGQAVMHIGDRPVPFAYAVEVA